MNNRWAQDFVLWAGRWPAGLSRSHQINQPVGALRKVIIKIMANYETTLQPCVRVCFRGRLWRQSPPQYIPTKRYSTPTSYFSPETLNQNNFIPEVISVSFSPRKDLRAECWSTLADRSISSKGPVLCQIAPPEPPNIFRLWPVLLCTASRLLCTHGLKLRGANTGRTAVS